MHRRTALITAASIAAVVLTGATAVGANIGILSNASASDVGDLTAVTSVAQSAPLSTPEPSATMAPTATVDDGPQMTIQSFEADGAGIVEVQFGSDQLRLGSVDAGDGWAWSSTQAGDGELRVSFVSDAGDELEFVAELLPDGTLSARVDEMIVETIQGEPEVITVHERAATPTVGSTTSAPSTTAAPGASSAAATPGAAPIQPSPQSVPPAAAAQPAATAVSPTTVSPPPMPTSAAFDDSDSYDDHSDDSYEDTEDEYEHEEDEHEEDEHEEDEHEYEGADDDD